MKAKAASGAWRLPIVGKTIDMHLVIVRLFVFAFALASSVPVQATSPVAPAVAYRSIDRERLLHLHVREYAKVGLVLAGEESREGGNSRVTVLTFDYVEGGTVRLKQALDLSIGSQGATAGQCHPWPCEAGAPVIRTHDHGLESSIRAAHDLATQRIAAAVKESGGLVDSPGNH